MKTLTLTKVLFSAIALVVFFCLPAQAKQDHDKGKGNNGNGHEKDAPYGQTKEKNNNRPEMLDPYGHSKDNRMELYGNRGRPIRETIPDPVIPPPPPPDPVVPPPEPDPVTPPPEPEPEHEPDQVIPPLPPDYVPPQPDPRLLSVISTDSTTSRREPKSAPIPEVPF